MLRIFFILPEVSENQRFSYVFRGYRKTSAMKSVKLWNGKVGMIFLKAMAKRIILFSAILRMNIKGFKYFVISLPSGVIRVVLFKPFLIFPGYLYVVISKYPFWAFSETIFRSFTLFAIVEDIEVVWLDNNWQVHRIDDPIFIKSGEVISLGFALFFYLLFKTLQFIHFIELSGVSEFILKGNIRTGPRKLYIPKIALLHFDIIKFT